MKSYDFEYDGLRLSDQGFIICKFDSDNVETISNGSIINFNTTKSFNGSKYDLVNSEYSECLTATFQICKNSCEINDEEITIDEVRNIMKWLNRKEFHDFRLLDDEYINIYFEASFNVSKIEINGKIYGFELEMLTNRPFAIQNKSIIHIDNNNNNNDEIVTFYSNSDEEGYIYPEMEIIIGEDGDFEIYSQNENRRTIIKNCKSGEVITIDYPIIKTNRTEHKIQNDFNWIFYRIVTSFKNNRNDVAFSLPCDVTIKYNPIIKVGI